jgi:FixJ family two-component response regulator
MRVPALLAVFVLSLFPCVLSAQFTNASLTRSVRDPSKAGGAVDLLRKPVRREALLNAVHVALQQSDDGR